MLRGCIAASRSGIVASVFLLTAAATDEQRAAENGANNGENGKALDPILHGYPSLLFRLYITDARCLQMQDHMREAYKLYFLSEVAGCDKGFSVVLAGLLSVLVSVEAPLPDSLLTAGADSDAVDELLFALLPASFSARKSVT